MLSLLSFAQYRAPKKETIPHSTDMKNLFFTMSNVVFRFDKLEEGGIPRRRRNRSKKVEIPHLLRASDKRPTKVGGLGMPESELHALFACIYFCFVSLQSCIACFCVCLLFLLCLLLLRKILEDHNVLLAHLKYLNFLVIH